MGRELLEVFNYTYHDLCLMIYINFKEIDSRPFFEQNQQKQIPFMYHISRLTLNFKIYV